MQFASLNHALETAAKVVAPPPSRSADEWADQVRKLPPGSPEAGPYRTSRVPYLREPMRAATDHRIETIVIVCGAQMGKTEALNNVIGHGFDDGPMVPTIIVTPTQKLAKSLSEDRIRKMILSTPALTDKLETGRRDRVTEKYFAGVRLGFAWAGSATELASHPCGRVLMDEYDRMSVDVAGEGDPYVLAKARTRNYAAAKIIVTSTPTMEDASAIQRLFDQCEPAQFWEIACPHCKDYFRPVSKNLVWPKDAVPATARREGGLYCPTCGSHIEDGWKDSMNAAGRYRAYARDVDGEYKRLDDAPATSKMIGYWVSGLCSPWQTWRDLCGDLCAAYRSHDPETIQATLNTYCGELYRTTGDAPAWQDVRALSRPYARRTVPSSAQVITAGVDVQKDGLYFVLRGWGFNLSSWLIDHGFLAGDTEWDDVWTLLDRAIAVPIKDMPITRGFIDSGYRPGEAFRTPDNQVYAYCRRRFGMVFPSKGHDTQVRPLIARDIDVTVRGQTLKNALKLWHLDTDYFKTWIYSRVRWPETADSGHFLLHQDVDEDYCRQLVAEECVTKASGRRIWIARRSRPNHYLDAEACAVAAAFSVHVQALAENPPPPRPPAPSSSSSTRPASSPAPDRYQRRGL